MHGAKYNEWTLGTWLFNASLRKSSGSVIYSVRIRVRRQKSSLDAPTLSVQVSLFLSLSFRVCSIIAVIIKLSVQRSHKRLSLSYFFSLFLSLFLFVAASEEFERVDRRDDNSYRSTWKAEAFSSSLCSSSRRSHPSHPEISVDSHVRGYDYATLRAALTRGSVHAYIRHCA